jgi:ABC-type Fe3+-hydroxamate transport system substrate-binding protein
MFLHTPDELPIIPKRIVSLVPSQTELLHYLGLGPETVGITKFCVHPAEWFQTKTRIGGTKDLKMAVIEQLDPDLVIANKEENEKTQVKVLANKYPVWLTDVNDLPGALQMIADIGKLTGKEKAAGGLITEIKQRFELYAAENTTRKKLRCVYLIWRKPYMTIGGDTFINDMLERCGFINIFKNEKRYPEVDIHRLAEAGCELLLLSSEPYPFGQQHMDELQQQLPDTKILLADGEMFSWYGSRLLQAPAYFKKLKEQCLS